MAIAGGLIDAFDTETIAPIESEIVAINNTIDLRDIGQRSDSEALEIINGQLLWMLNHISTTDTTIRGAGIFVDPEDGTIRMSVTEQQAGQSKTAEIRLDAAEANINLRTT